MDIDWEDVINELDLSMKTLPDGTQPFASALARVISCLVSEISDLQERVDELEGCDG